MKIALLEAGLDAAGWYLGNVSSSPMGSLDELLLMLPSISSSTYVVAVEERR